MSATEVTRHGSVPCHEGDPVSLLQQKEEFDMSRKEEMVVDLSSVTAAITSSVTADDNVDPKSMNWDLSMWLSSIIGYFGQRLVNYISGLSEKMEKLEYY